MIFDQFARIGSTTRLAQQLARDRVMTRAGKPIDKLFLHRLLRQPGLHRRGGAQGHALSR